MAELRAQALASTEDKSPNLFKDCLEIILKRSPAMLILFKSACKQCINTNNEFSR
jgi:hypothetical protein